MARGQARQQATVLLAMALEPEASAFTLAEANEAARMATMNLPYKPDEFRAVRVDSIPAGIAHAGGIS